MFEVTVLSVLQGIAEFLPISSSGHLVIAQNLLGVNAPGMRLDVFLHLGTLLAIVVYYWRTIARLLTLRGESLSYIIRIGVSALPAVAVYFIFKAQIEALFENSRMVGALLMFTGAILLGTKYMPRGTHEVSFLRALAMGAAQALALLPGVSRSGMTLAAARCAKVEAGKAAEFSFLMSAPLIAGAAVLELVKAANGVAAAGEPGWGVVAYGAIVAAIVGYASLALLVRLLKGRGFWLFGVYCMAAGLATLVFVK